jgi:hypothetical protein
MTLVNSMFIFSTFGGWSSPLNVLSAIISICEIQKSRLRTETPTLDIVTRTLCDVFHHFEHSRDCLLQDVCLFVDDLVCDLAREKQNALQPIRQVQWHLVVLILFPQKLKQPGVTSASEAQGDEQTSNVTLVTLKAAFAISFN